jgi:putative oxidoreductase
LNGKYADEAHGLFRIFTAGMFALHGSMKLFGFPKPGGRVQLESLLGVAGVLELAGGLLVMFGLLTRPVALLLCGEMAVAYFMEHATGGFWPVRNGGELAVLYCFAFLHISQNGPGAWAVDSKR